MHHNTANLKIIEIFDAGPPGTCVTQGPTTKFGSSDHVQSIFSSNSWGFGAGMVIYNLVLVPELVLGILGFDNTATCPKYLYVDGSDLTNDIKDFCPGTHLISVK